MSVSILATTLAGTGSALVATAPADAMSGTELTLSAAADTYTSSSRPGAAFGAEDKLVVGKLDRDLKTSYLKFVVPAGARVTGARLNLVAAGAVTGPITVSRVRTNSWTEKLTATGAPALGPTVATAKPQRGDAEVSFDLGAEVTGPGTYSFAVRSAATTPTRFRSAEAATGRPVLIVLTRAATTVPATTPTATPAGGDRRDCVVNAKLVPSCGVLWGGAAGGFTDAPRDQALIAWEKISGRTSTIFHQYHKGDEVFPTKAEIAMTRDPSRPRVLLLNWKIAYGSTWAKVAAGNQDKRIDAFAARVKATYPEKFFLALNHEPENDVVAKAGSGFQAKDFAAMYRHTILRLRAKGLTNAINVMAYMGNEKWMSQSWWKDIYPGDDVVDWMGLDSYVSAEKGAYHYGLFADLLDRKGTTGPGFYQWATTKHASKPLMIAEWGAYHRVGKPVDKAPQYRSVRPELGKRPAIKAIVHFDTARDDQGDRDISINSTTTGLAAFRRLAADPVFDVKLK